MVSRSVFLCGNFLTDRAQNVFLWGRLLHRRCDCASCSPTCACVSAAKRAAGRDWLWRYTFLSSKRGRKGVMRETERGEHGMQRMASNQSSFHQAVSQSVSQLTVEETHSTEAAALSVQHTVNYLCTDMYTIRFCFKKEEGGRGWKFTHLFNKWGGRAGAARPLSEIKVENKKITKRRRTKNFDVFSTGQWNIQRILYDNGWYMCLRHSAVSSQRSLTVASWSPPGVIIWRRAPAVQAAGPGFPVRWDQGGGGQARSGQLCSSAIH